MKRRYYVTLSLNQLMLELFAFNYFIYISLIHYNIKLSLNLIMINIFLLDLILNRRHNNHLFSLFVVGSTSRAPFGIHQRWTWRKESPGNGSQRQAERRRKK